jgi:hypothetical protein
VLYYILGALGTHAPVKSLKDRTDDSDTQRYVRTVPILETNPSALTIHRAKSGCSFVGRLVIILFALIQAIGATILYIRRTEHTSRYETSGLDHRIGWLAISSAVCSMANFITLVTHAEYSIEEDMMSEEDLHLLSSSQRSFQSILLEISVALFVHGILEDSIPQNIKESSRTVVLIYQDLRPQTITLGIVLLLLRIF